MNSQPMTNRRLLTGACIRWPFRHIHAVLAARLCPGTGEGVSECPGTGEGVSDSEDNAVDSGTRHVKHSGHHSV